ncbi:location of vulva defective 1-like [Ostrea edulis]|uniref:location of vulva defective 1-like n=1 Tax=Ostrea edulis TaxID=37623 RepID=UPI0024AF9DBB|nr:location of vulva defective 1-like [Ostrea edulis]
MMVSISTKLFCWHLLLYYDFGWYYLTEAQNTTSSDWISSTPINYLDKATANLTNSTEDVSLTTDYTTLMTTEPAIDLTNSTEDVSLTTDYTTVMTTEPVIDLTNSTEDVSLTTDYTTVMTTEPVIDLTNSTEDVSLTTDYTTVMTTEPVIEYLCMESEWCLTK